MKAPHRTYLASQSGFTLVEVIITSAIGAVLLAALSSVVLTSIKAWSTANSRVAASAQVRNFQFVAYDDFARSTVPTLPPGCGTRASPCTTQPLVLTGLQASNSAQPAISAYQVTYTWDGTAFLDRRFLGNPRHVASDVSAFSWYVDTSNPNHPTVVVSLTVTVPPAGSIGAASAFLGDPYSESQTMRFYPRLN